MCIWVVFKKLVKMKTKNMINNTFYYITFFLLIDYLYLLFRLSFFTNNPYKLI